MTTKSRMMSNSDLEFIKENCGRMTDKQIANVLGRSERGIADARLRLGIKKPAGKMEAKHEDLAVFDARKGKKSVGGVVGYDFWKNQLISSDRGVKIRELLSESDWDFFVDEWVSFHLQFEDLTHTEKITIEHIILLRLRILQNQKDLQDAMEQKRKLGDISVSELDLDNEEEQQRFQKYNALESHVNDLNKEYRELLDKANSLFRSLSGTREQREKKGQVTRETFFSLCEKFRKEKVRHTEGRFAELLKLAMYKNMDTLRESIQFVDGEIAPQLLDARTVHLAKEQQDDSTQQDDGKDKGSESEDSG